MKGSARNQIATSIRTRAHYTAQARLPHNWHDRLQAPASYYAKHVTKWGKRNGDCWAQGRCSFHDDNHASLSVNLQREGVLVDAQDCASHALELMVETEIKSAPALMRYGVDYE